jgi:hypothetical protein
MQSLPQTQSRKNFVKWGLGILTSLTVLKLAGSAGPKKQNEDVRTIKMLGEDGKLVEVIQHTLPAKRKKISDKELRNWIKK